MSKDILTLQIKGATAADISQTAVMTLHELSCSQDDAKWLSVGTKKQSDNSIWHEQRKGGITASKMLVYITYITSTGCLTRVSSTVASVMHYYDQPTGAALCHEHETKPKM